jgi:ATP-dependent Lon protease
MSHDSKTKMFKSETNKNKKKYEDIKQKRKIVESSDDESICSDDEEEDEMDLHEYRKFLKNIFPSKHLDNKIKAGERIKKYIKEEEEDDEEEDEEEEEIEEIKPKKSNKKHTNQNKLKKEKIKKEESDNEEDDDEEYVEEKSPKASKFNIIFTIGSKSKNKGKNYYEDEEDDYSYEDEEDWETCSGSSSNTENEDDIISSDSENESDVDDEEDLEDSEEEYKPKKRKQFKRSCKKVKDKDKEKNKDKEDKNEKNNEKEEEKEEEKEDTNICEKSSSLETNNTNNINILSQLKELQNKNPNDKIMNKCINFYETNIKKENKKRERKIKKEKARNARIFGKILRDKNTTNDFDFYEKLDTEHQKKIIKELREINKLIRVEKPYRLTLLESDIPIIFKSAAMKKISSLRYMESGTGEYYKIKNWVDTFMRIPFGKYETLPLSISDGVDKCHDFMERAQKTLDDSVYGLNDAKMQIMQMLGQLVTNPKSIGSAIAIHGPPGTGKTTLVKEGISKILNRPFAFIALGGATDSSFLEGHGYTYEGSTWGKIVQILIDSKCMNPVIYFDELDKISDTPKGEEIAGILTHLTDTSQNSQFHDKYFSEIDFDLSKCLFIFSYNDESKVNSILKDRMYRIQTKGYNQKQKTVIADNYLLPKIREQVKFTCEDIIIPNETLHYIIEHTCNKEDGVRNLKRCLEIIYTKLNLYRLMKPETNLFEEDMSLKVQFPFTVTKNMVDKLIKKSENSLSSSLYMLYS